MALAGEVFLGVEVRTQRGWTPRGRFWEAGPEILKRQVLDLDLSGAEGDTVRVRLESAPSLWLIDRVAMDFSPERPVAVQRLALTQARDGNGRDVREALAAGDGRALTLETGDAAELRFAAPDPAAGLGRSYLLRSTGWYRIHVAETGQPDVALLARIGSGGYSISRISVGRLNDALAAMQRAAR